MKKLVEATLIALVAAAVVWAAIAGGHKQQAYYDSIDHPVYSTQAIEAKGR